MGQSREQRISKAGKALVNAQQEFLKACIGKSRNGKSLTKDGASFTDQRVTYWIMIPEENGLPPELEEVHVDRSYIRINQDNELFVFACGYRKHGEMRFSDLYANETNGRIEEFSLYQKWIDDHQEKLNSMKMQIGK